MEEWKEYKLEEIVDINPTESLKKGTVAKKIGMDILQPYTRAIPDYTLEPFSGGTKFRNGDTIMARITPCLENGKTAMVNILDKDEIGFGSTEYIVFRAKEGVSDPFFIYYLVTSSEVREPAIKSMVGSSGRQRVQTDVVANLSIKLPPLPTQQKIAAILSSLDDKIELNNKINTNLEQQAQALFKNWFVDFEPFGGKMPEGWKTISLEEFCSEIVRGYTPNYVDYSDRPILNQKVNKGFNLETQYYKYNSNEDTIPENKYANFGDVLLNSLGQGTLGRTHLYRDDKSNIIIDQFITVLRTNSFVKSAYLEFVLSSEQGQKEVLSRITGSTGMWVLTINNIRKIPIVCPNDSDFKEIETIITNIYKTISGNVKENYNLATIRDTLLPKLMNGDI